MEKLTFSVLENKNLKPEQILLNSFDLSGYKSALELLSALAKKLSDFKPLYFEKNPITFCIQQDGKLMKYENLEINNFVDEVAKQKDLKPQLDEFFEKISNECVYVSGDYYFRELICEYACLKKENIKYYINFLSSIEEDTDLEADDVDNIIKKHGWCNENIDLVLHRYFADSPVPHGRDQVAQFIKNEGLDKYLKEEKNIEFFIQKISENYANIDENEEEYLNETTKELFEELFLDDTIQVQIYFEKVIILANSKYKSEVDFKQITNKKEAEHFILGLNKRADEGKKKDKEDVSEIYLEWSKGILNSITNEKKWNIEIDEKLKFAAELGLLSLNYFKKVEKIADYYDSRTTVIAQIYNLIGSLLNNNLQHTEDENLKIDYLEKAISNFILSIKYCKSFINPQENLSNSLVLLLKIGDKNKQISKYKNEVEFFRSNYNITNKKYDSYFTLYTNYSILFFMLEDLQYGYNNLQLSLEINQKVNNFKKDDYYGDDFKSVRDEKRFIELVEKYFNSQN